MGSRESPAGQASRAASGAALLGAGLSGALAGAITALLDVARSFSALGQYLPSFVGKLSLLLHLALSYSLTAALVGVALGALLCAIRASALPEFGRALLSREGALGSETNKSLIAVGLPVLLVAAALSYSSALQFLIARRHPGLVILSAIAITLLTLVLAALVTFIGAALVKRPVARLTSRLSPWLLAGMETLLIAGLGYALWYRAMATLPLGARLLCFAAIVVLLLLPTILRRALAMLPKARAAVHFPLAGFVHLLTGLPLLGASVVASYKLAAGAASAPTPLLIAQTMATTSLAVCLAVLVGVVSAHALYPRFHSLSESGVARHLRSPRAPMVLALVLVILPVLAAMALWWPTLRLLHLRPFAVAVLMLSALITVRSLGRVLAGQIGRLGLALRWLFVVGLIASSFTLMIATGSSESVRKAQVLHTGLGEPFAKLYRKLGDWDRDGYSRWLGGGDCDDSDAYVHPNAEEIPGDGVDNNCNAGDVTERRASATAFADRPPGLPADFNVVLISIDTIRADHLGAYGYSRNTTPNLDTLAAAGTLFINAWAHAPSTRYSIPAMLTGRYPLNVRYFDIPRQWPGLSEENLTIAEVLLAQGFKTGAILNYWYFDAVRKMNQGFEHYDNQNKRLHRPVAGEGPAKTSGTSSKEQTDKAIEFVGENAAKPFFLWVHYYDPHYDYETHPDTPRFGNSKIDGYDHEIAFTDHHIGRLIDDLKARGLYEKTVFVVTGDHGEGFGEHGIDLHGYHLYAAQTKVPLIMRVPGTEPSVVTTPASHVDILPTLANLSGFPSRAEMLGRSLLGLITGAEDRDTERYVFQQLSYENNNEYRGAVSAKCHVLFNVSPNLSWELYRIDRDPMETQDIIDNPGECAGAREILEAWYDDSQIPEGAASALLGTTPTIAKPLDINFGSAIRLLEWQMPKTVQRGQSFPMDITWQGRGRPPPGRKVFAHFESEHGRFTGDHRPVRPFSWWRKGQYIRYQHEVTVPASTRPGRYTLWMGIYKGNERMKVTSDQLQAVDRRVPILEIEVVP